MDTDSIKHARNSVTGTGRSLLVALLVVAGLWLGAALSLVPGSAAFSAAANDGPGTLRFSPATPVLEAGGIVTVEVWLDGGFNYYGLDLRISFDPEVLRVQPERVLPLWDVFDPINHFAIKNMADNTNGMVWYAVTNMNPAEAFTGTGRICAVAFTGIAAGTSQLHVSYAKGSTRTGEGLYPTLVDGLVTVNQPVRYLVLMPVVVRDLTSF